MIHQKLLLFVLCLLSISTWSQVTFEPGYWINQTNQKKQVLIKHKAYQSNPENFTIKQNENTEEQLIGLDNIKEIMIFGDYKYVKATVDLDMSAHDINDLENDPAPQFKSTTLLLRELVNGQSDLYEYIDGQTIRYFYRNAGGEILPLVYKQYKTSSNQIAENKSYQNQLYKNLNCDDTNRLSVETIGYNRKDLINFFTHYSQCSGTVPAIYTPKKNKPIFHFRIKPKLSFAEVSTTNPKFEFRNVDFNSKVNIGGGIEFEYILPFNRKKWGIALGAYYQKYTAENQTNVDASTGLSYLAEIDYSMIDIPLSLRHYMFLNANSTIFLNLDNVYSIASSSQLRYTRDDASVLNESVLENVFSFGFGVGYQYNSKYSIEVNYIPSRNINDKQVFYESKYSSLSIILGYAIF